MTNPQFPPLDPEQLSVTRDALHAYAGILGGWLTTCRTGRKHWWHASLRPSLTGVTTDVIYTDATNFEIALDLRESELSVFTSVGELLTEKLVGQAPIELATKVREFLVSAGVPEVFADSAESANSHDLNSAYDAYSTEEANKLGRALGAISATVERFRADIREETSPVGIWPHHFDLAMLWLPGDKVEGQDPENEEYADKQMNFGFTFGDASIPEPYFYITAYPLPDSFPAVSLPPGTRWQSNGFSGAVLEYRRLLEEPDPAAYLLRLWNRLLVAGKSSLISYSK